MRRADRLFQLIQILRRERGRPVTAATLAAELEVTVRTVYRDMADLQAQRVPIRGEAGVGYVLGSGYDLPALMFTEDEIEALVLGARIVQSWADPGLGRAAGDLLAKVAAVVPPPLRAKIDGLSLFSPPAGAAPPPGLDVARLRRWVREQRKLRIAYADAAGVQTARILWPQALAFFPPVWLLVGWCELRQDFRSFRLDRVGAADFLEERYPQIQGRRLVDFIARMRAEPAAEGPSAGRR
ncbi:helix-turn-helix transcriptional regulator [Oleisolibacter albus]|uniref:helix-turn-helix transcriptional regulator n=1 Tax=Oleisolibacter albus TaxID=2171757 RepID=UPI000DF25FFF|nr:YafY family protein [Oleisolibacter albus]